MPKGQDLHSGRSRRDLRQRVVRDQVRDKLDFAFEDMGERRQRLLDRGGRVSTPVRPHGPGDILHLLQ
jgi:hypothetical protein